MKRDASFTRLALVLACIVLALASVRAQDLVQTFVPGDIFVSVGQSSIQWRDASGALKAILASHMSGKVEGLQLDAAGNLYVTHWCTDHLCTGGNSIEQFDAHGVSHGPVGNNFFCNPHSLAFDGAGNVFVGQADCDGTVMKFVRGDWRATYYVEQQSRGAFWIDLAADDCTLGYTSWGPDVKVFDVCNNVQRPNFNKQPVPGGAAQALIILPQGGVLVSTGNVISRLDGDGGLAQTYAINNEQQYWAGIDLVGDGTFWAINYYSSNVYRFNLATGEVVGSFHTDGDPQTVIDIRVFRISPPPLAGQAPRALPSFKK